jgi:hypothetical protein
METELPSEINVVSGGIMLCSACGASFARGPGSCPVCGGALYLSKLHIRHESQAPAREGRIRRILRSLRRLATAH